MQPGMIELGRMSSNMVCRLMNASHECRVHELHAEAIKNLQEKGAIGASSLQDLAPGVDAAPPTSGRKNRDGTAEQGYLHCGPTGAGHFVKMVHKDIGYGLMAAYAEGLNILCNAGAGKRARDTYYQYELDLPEIAEVWRRGSVIGLVA